MTHQEPKTLNKPSKKHSWSRKGCNADTHKQIVALKTHPAIKSQREIAKIVGVTEETVCKVLKENRPTIQQIEIYLKEYDSILRETLSVRDRAALYIQVARENITKYPMATLKALERMDDLQGIVTERDKMRVKLLETAPKAEAPMFMLPAGSFVRVTRAEISSGQEEVKQLEEAQLEGDSKPTTD